MQKELSVDSNNVLLPAEDYHFLRAEGIRLIQRLSGKVWTDYNTHDPGITLLEALCYTLTDLGYRTSFDIKDLLTPPDEGHRNDLFLTARQILPSNPVTVTDYRKLIIDTDGVKNAWIEPSNEYEVLLYLASGEEAPAAGNNPSFRLSYANTSGADPLRIKGLYKVMVEYEDEVLTANRQEAVDTTIRKKLNLHRNLCEDFLSIRPVDYELFKMEALVQVSEGADIERINARIFQVIHNFFSPGIRFYTLDQMLEKGYSTEEIFEGPSLKNGFIDTAELEGSGKYMDIHLSDIINLITDIPGVIAVKKCVFPIETQSAFSDFTRWITNIKEKEKVPRLDIDSSVINFIRSGDRHRNEKDKIPDKERVKAIYFFLQSEQPSSKLKGTANDIAVPAGEFMNVGEYFPFQYILPAAYGMQEKVIDADIDGAAIKAAVTEIQNSADSHGTLSARTRLLDAIAREQLGLSLPDLPPAGLARMPQLYINYQLNHLPPAGKQILQLRGFLMIFEQIMADYLSQLANIGQLFSLNPVWNQTYFPQPLQGINDLEPLFISFSKYCEELPRLLEKESGAAARRNGILDHLLARVGENADIYIPSAAYKDKNEFKRNIERKSTLLGDYTSVSSYRGAGFDYSDKEHVWDTGNITGMKRRICRLLGLQNPETAFITSDLIAIEKAEQPDRSIRTKIVLKETGKDGMPLLESKAYEHDTEIDEVLNYILGVGFNRSFYDVDERKGKYTYRLKRPNGEEETEFVATHEATDKEALESSLQKTLELVQRLADSGNFHLVEHILLRPRINPQKAAGAAKPEAVELLRPTAVPHAELSAGGKGAAATYNFRITAVEDPEAAHKIVWKLSLRKERTDVIMIEDDFVFKSHTRKRIEHLRQVATDSVNYKREKNADNRSLFSITDGSRVLAVSKKTYAKEEEMEEEITSLIKYFSYELKLVDEEEADAAGYADPYSFRLSLFVPAWPLQFRDPVFRHLFEKAVYLETPAHVHPQIYWLGYRQMKEFEIAYKAWLQEMALNEIPDTGVVNHLVNIINTLSEPNAE